jgi:hypothetical protein
MSDVATWGTASADSQSDTEAPSTHQDDDLDIHTDDDWSLDGDWTAGALNRDADDEPDPVQENTSSELTQHPVEPAPAPNSEEIAPVNREEGIEDESPPVKHKRRRRKHKKRRNTKLPRFQDYEYIVARVSAAVDELSENVTQSHFDILHTQALQQLIADEPGREIIKSSTVRDATGPEQEKWKTAAEAELANNFIKMGAYHDSTAEELARYGRPLPMLCVWSTADENHKC